MDLVKKIRNFFTENQDYIDSGEILELLKEVEREQTETIKKIKEADRLIYDVMGEIGGNEKLTKFGYKAEIFALNRKLARALLKLRSVSAGGAQRTGVIVTR